MHIGFERFQACSRSRICFRKSFTWSKKKKKKKKKSKKLWFPSCSIDVWLGRGRPRQFLTLWEDVCATLRQHHPVPNALFLICKRIAMLHQPCTSDLRDFKHAVFQEYVSERTLTWSKKKKKKTNNKNKKKCGFLVRRWRGQTSRKDVRTNERLPRPTDGFAMRDLITCCEANMTDANVQMSQHATCI